MKNSILIPMIILLAFSNVPELGMKLAKLMRTIKIKNEVYILSATAIL